MFLNISIPRDSLSAQNLYGWKRPLQSPSPTLLHCPALLPPASSTGHCSLQFPPHFSYFSTHLFLPAGSQKGQPSAAPSCSSLDPLQRIPVAPASSLPLPSILHQAEHQSLQTILEAAATLGNHLLLSQCFTSPIPKTPKTRAQRSAPRGAARTHLAASSASSSH